MSLEAQFNINWKAQCNTTAAPLLLAVSGGLDSMVMASLFLSCKTDFAVAHCNFGLRGDESDSDEAFVKAWCEDHGIPFFYTRFDTAARAAACGKSIQLTARDLRYEWFHALAAEHQFSAICTAHHADDNAETMLMHLCRGTGIAGLHGIPERNGIIRRPLLFATRSAIQAYATDHNIPYREDSSNVKDDYLRNALRHHILPLIEEWMPGAALRMLETANRIGEAEEIYRKGIEAERKKLVEQRGKDYYIPIKLLKHRSPLATIVYELLLPFGFLPAQVPLALALLDAENGKLIASPTHRLIRNRDFLIITANTPQRADFYPIAETTTEIETSEGSFTFENLQKPPKDLASGAHIALIDADKIEAPLILRRRKAGDYFYPLGMGMKKKKISRYLTDLKLPLHLKESLWVLEANQRIVWLAGHRLDERFKITPATKNILKLTFSGTGNAGASSVG